MNHSTQVIDLIEISIYVYTKFYTTKMKSVLRLGNQYNINNIYTIYQYTNLLWIKVSENNND